MTGKKRTRKLFLIVGLLLFGLLCAAAVSADPQTGSIEARLPEQGSYTDLKLNAYQIMEPQEDGTYAWTADFKNHPEVILESGKNAEAQEAAETLAEYAIEQGISGYEQGVSADGTVIFENIPEGYYLITQESGEEKILISPSLVMIPVNEGTAKGINYDVVITLKTETPDGAVLLSKISDDPDPLAVQGAQFVLQEKVYLAEGETAPEDADTGSDEQGDYYWKQLDGVLPETDAQGRLAINDLHFGDYRLVEEAAPEGYLLADPREREFTVSTAGDVSSENGDITGTPEQVIIVDPTTYIEVLKQDEDGNALPDAHLTVKNGDGTPILDENGKLVYDIETGTEPVPVRRLAPGDYYLTEVAAPEGYQIAEDVPFSVSGTEQVTVPITMTDEKKDDTPYTLKVEKALQIWDDDDTFDLIASEDSFYVALFQDEKRVSDVKELYYSGESTTTVTFYDLVPGETYTVYETDAAGNPIDGGEKNGANYTAMFDQEKVTIDPNTRAEEFRFANLFFDVPDNYYYEGDITVTKRTIRDGEAYATNNTYYIGIFADEDCTELYQLVELNMDGSDEASMRIPVALGESVEEVRTFYIAEVQKNGDEVEVLENGSGLDFEISINGEDKNLEAVTVQPAADSSVIVTNEYHTPTPTPTLTPGPTTPGSPNSPGSPSDQVKTEDPTQIKPYVIILAGAALAVIILLLILILRNRKK
ncbi:MAG: hypothetical protein IJW67_01030 [Blautia sp.]|nr:hypothetical protein [Blautia sp.]